MRIPALAAMILVACSGGESTTPTVADSAAISTDTSESADTASADTRKDPWDGGMPSAECVAHCECMKANCAMYSGYPYAEVKDCTDHCGTFSAAEMKCWTYFCNEAKTASTNKDHWCQHAWGTWGLEECPK